jgi:hypothetical protein
MTFVKEIFGNKSIDDKLLHNFTITDQQTSIILRAGDGLGNEHSGRLVTLTPDNKAVLAQKTTTNPSSGMVKIKTEDIGFFTDSEKQVSFGYQNFRFLNSNIGDGYQILVSGLNAISQDNFFVRFFLDLEDASAYPEPIACQIGSDLEETLQNFLNLQVIIDLQIRYGFTITIENSESLRLTQNDIKEGNPFSDSNSWILPNQFPGFTFFIPQDEGVTYEFNASAGVDGWAAMFYSNSNPNPNYVVLAFNDEPTPLITRDVFQSELGTPIFPNSIYSIPESLEDLRDMILDYWNTNLSEFVSYFDIETNLDEGVEFSLSLNPEAESPSFAFLFISYGNNCPTLAVSAFPEILVLEQPSSGNPLSVNSPIVGVLNRVEGGKAYVSKTYLNKVCFRPGDQPTFNEMLDVFDPLGYYVPGNNGCLEKVSSFVIDLLTSNPQFPQEQILIAVFKNAIYVSASLEMESSGKAYFKPLDKLSILLGIMGGDEG